jgi:hypothetical protein
VRRLRVTVAVCVVCVVCACEAARAGNLLVDPTRPVSATDSPLAAREPGGVHVQAIVIRADSRVAVVDGRVVRAGDHIANVFIEEVTPEGVRYSQDGHSRFARLKCPTPLPLRRGVAPKRDLP